ncbi:MAG TPA: regulatory protein RecX [Saprospiraceae bacterium]|nr:regulatory protein RecX [Saprospiraceae bacterium]HMP12341.1 regulatory protein RecX [Saprospiraceae bacterium]
MKPKLSPIAALQKLQRYCAYQERSHQEVRGKLLDLGIYGDTLEEIMAQLIADNFLNEERYARAYARGKFRMKQWGRRRIEQELQARKVSAYSIGKAMEEIPAAAYEATLLAILQKQKVKVAETDAFAQHHKIAQYAIRKGFEPELVWQVIQQQLRD